MDKAARDRFPRPVTGVFLDLGWTLLYPLSGDWLITRCFEAHAGKGLQDLDPARIHAAKAVAQRYLDRNHRVSSVEAEYAQFCEYYRILAAELPELGLSPAATEDMARDRTYNDDNYIFYEDVTPALEALSGRVKLGVISDTWPSANRFLKRAGIWDYFDSITFSCDLGVFKPDSRMYMHAVAASGLQAAGTVFVDDFNGNLAGAEGCGIFPVLIARDNRNQKEADAGYVTVGSMADLLEGILS